jgi:hypothetical protein
MRFAPDGRGLVPVRRAETAGYQCAIMGAVNDLLCDEFLKSESGAAILGIRSVPAVIDTAGWYTPLASSSGRFALRLENCISADISFFRSW